MVRSRSSEISKPLAEISFFGKTREDPVKESRDDNDDDESHESEEAHPTIVDESLSKPKKKRKGSKRKIQGKDTQ